MIQANLFKGGELFQKFFYCPKKLGSLLLSFDIIFRKTGCNPSSEKIAKSGKLAKSWEFVNIIQWHAKSKKLGLLAVKTSD